MTGDTTPSRDSGPVLLWHDDVRPAPEGWTWAKTNAEAIKILETGRVATCSLDHDLGATPPSLIPDEEIVFLRGASPDGSGYDLVRWMIEHRRVPANVTIHSWNPSGAQRMARAFLDAGYTPSVEPYVARAR